MVVAALFLTLTALSDLHARAQPAGMSSHLVVPTGVAVPVDLRGGSGSASDLFRLPVHEAVATTTVGNERVKVVAVDMPAVPKPGVLCHL